MQVFERETPGLVSGQPAGLANTPRLSLLPSRCGEKVVGTWVRVRLRGGEWWPRRGGKGQFPEALPARLGTPQATARSLQRPSWVRASLRNTTCSQAVTAMRTNRAWPGRRGVCRERTDGAEPATCPQHPVAPPTNPSRIRGAPPPPTPSPAAAESEGPPSLIWIHSAASYPPPPPASSSQQGPDADASKMLFSASCHSGRQLCPSSSGPHCTARSGPLFTF